MITCIIVALLTLAAKGVTHQKYFMITTAKMVAIILTPKLVHVISFANLRQL